MKGQLTVVWQRQLQMHNGTRGGGREAEGGAGGCGPRQRKTRTKKEARKSLSCDGLGRIWTSPKDF